MADQQVRLNPTLLAMSISGLFWHGAQAQALPAQPDRPITPELEIPQVLVTAQRTLSLESKTPVAMSVLSGEQLQKAGLDRPSELAARLPNVHLDGAADGLKITIRGVTNADTTEKGDPSAAFMLDGVYIARPQVQNLAFFDLERVEVLRGPQGTLYGRNTTAGAVNVISNAPGPRFEGAVSAELGNYGTRNTGAMLNVPLSPALALRAAVATNEHDSYLRNSQGTGHHLGLDRDDQSARLSARLAMGDHATLLLRYDHSRVRDNPDVIVPDTNFFRRNAAGAPVWYEAGTEQRLTNGFKPPNMVPVQGYGNKTSDGLGAELRWDLGPATLHYLGSRREFQHDFLTNYYYRLTPGFAIGVRQSFDGDYAQNSHELRLANKPGGPFTVQGGLYYFSEVSHQTYAFRDLELTGLPPYYVFPHGPTRARSKAAFAQASYRVIDALRLTAGLRYTDDEKSRLGSTNYQQTAKFNPATDKSLPDAAYLANGQSTWRLGLDYDLAPASLLYASIATGYKAGGFNEGCARGSAQLGVACPAEVAVPASSLFYQPETLKSYEAGLKTRFWGNTGSLNLAAFQYDYRNLQLSGVAMFRGAPRFVTANAGVASVKGLELDGQLRTSTMGRLSYGLTLLDAHYVSYVPDGVHSWAGSKLDRAPGRSLTLGYEHRWHLAAGQLSAGLNARRQGAYQINVPTQLLQYRIDARTESDATIAYQPDGAAWSLRALVKNLENKVQPITIDSFGMTVPSAPRTVSLRADLRF